MLAEPYINWLAYMPEQPKHPQTISATCKKEYEVSQDHAMGVCHLFTLLGSRGLGVLFSTGDWGVGPGNCLAQSSSGDISPVPPPVPRILFFLCWKAVQTEIQVTQNITTFS